MTPLPPSSPPPSSPPPSSLPRSSLPPSPSRSGPRLSRRRFLAGSAAFAGTAFLATGLPSRLAFAAEAAPADDAPADDARDGSGTDAVDVLVVLSLRGGMDGLNVVVPAGDAAYAALRPGIAIPASRLLRIDGMFGLHPALQPLWPLWEGGSMAAVHAVGQSDPTRSHFQAIAEMERAAPGTSLRTGWLDRAVATRPGAGTFAAVQLGSALPALALAGPAPDLAVGRLDDVVLWAADDDEDPAWSSAETTRWGQALTALHADAPAALAVPATAAVGALGTVARLSAAGDLPGGGAAYDDNDIGRALRDVARLIRGDVGLRVACVEYGDWDMHEGMGDVDGGWLVDRLSGLARALAAFATDLGPRWASTTVVTLSEFGRRVEENGSGGVDHGHGNAVLLLGGGIVGGRVHGSWPGLADADLDQGDLAGATDYRTVLAEILRKRCGIGDLGAVFPGSPGLPAAELGVARIRG